MIIFDAVGTLIRPAEPIFETYAMQGRQFGSGLAAEQIRQRFRVQRDRWFGASNTASVENQLHSDEVTEKRRWQQLVFAVFDDVAEPQLLFEQLWRYFAEPRVWKVYDDATTCLQTLAGRNITWCMASNFDRRLLGICRGHWELTQARRIFLSTQLGWRKPHPDFFNEIQRELRAQPNQLLMVGDHWVNDFDAARRCGWNALLVDRQTTRSEASTIGNLNELVGRLDESLGGG